jgi:hypothetical protein
MRQHARFAALFCALISGAWLASPVAGAHETPVHALFVGDSVPAALGYQPAVEQSLGRGLDLRFDLKVCRRLATAGCPYRGTMPSSALEAVRTTGSGCGRVLVVDVGYNDDPDTYGPQMVQVIDAAKAVGVRQIVWVTLRETDDLYSRINTVIRIEAGRFPIVQVADWNAFSSGKNWFRPDGLHLNDAGAVGLAALLRPYLVHAAAAARTTTTSSS